MIRIGHGYDVHRLVPDRKLILGGVEITHETGLLGHSDADVLTHAVMDALLGAAAMVLETNIHPAVLKDQVTSPGGTTSRGLEKLAEKGFSGTVIQAVRAASARSAELGKK